MPHDLAIDTGGRGNTGWWGVLCLIATEASLFAYLLFSYFYMAVQHDTGWSPEPHPAMGLAGPNTLILLSSSVAVWWGERGLKRGSRGQHLGGLVLAIALGLVFLAVQMVEWREKTYRPADGSYASLYFTITGFHMAHVVVGLMVLATVLGWSIIGHFDRTRHQHVSIAGIYWHFVDVVWLFVFFTFYLSPYLMEGSP